MTLWNISLRLMYILQQNKITQVDEKNDRVDGKQFSDKKIDK